MVRAGFQYVTHGRTISTMIALARIAERGPLIAASLAAILLLCALWLPALMGAASSVGLLFLASLIAMCSLIASAAVVAFVALRHGEMAALKVVGGCLLLLIVVSAVLYGSAVYVPLVATIFWLPAIVAAIVLSRSVKLDYAVMAIVVCGAFAVIGFSIVVGDGTQFWRTMFSEAGTVDLVGQGGGASAITDEQREAFIDTMARVMTGAMGLSVMNIALGALFLARSWQAALFNPGGFRKEFHALSLGRNMALFCLLVITLALMQGGQIAGAIAMVVIFAFFIQGLAVTHALVQQRGMHRYWLYGMYVLLLLPHTLFLLAALGVADNLFRLRRA